MQSFSISLNCFEATCHQCTGFNNPIWLIVLIYVNYTINENWSHLLLMPIPLSFHFNILLPFIFLLLGRVEVVHHHHRFFHFRSLFWCDILHRYYRCFMRQVIVTKNMCQLFYRFGFLKLAFRFVLFRWCTLIWSPFYCLVKLFLTWNVSLPTKTDSWSRGYRRIVRNKDWPCLVQWLRRTCLEICRRR